MHRSGKAHFNSAFRGYPVLGVSFLVLFLSFPVAQASSPDQPLEYDWGPLVSRHTDVNGDLRFRFLGPFFEWAQSPQGDRLWAVRPFHGSAWDAKAERKVSEFLWPIEQGKRFRNEFSRRFLLAYYLDYDTTAPKSQYHFWILPLYFQGRDIHGKNYLALFPIGGSIRDFLMRDKIYFVLFPLYAYSSINEVKTYDALWPIYSKTEGKGIKKFRIFPFYGRNLHRGWFEKRFVLWPIWTWGKYRMPGSSGSGYVVFPLWGHMKLEDQESWLFVPPFVRFSKGQRLNYVYCWPFFVKRSGEVEQLYFWPLWGRKSMKGCRTSFFLWPIFRTERLDRGNEVGKRFLALPFLQSEIRRDRTNVVDGKKVVTYRYRKLWPLCSYIEDRDSKRFRFLDLWPLKDTAPVERCYAPFWTLYVHLRHGDAYSDEALWGLFRRQREGTRVYDVSLFPLFSWRRDDRDDGTRQWSVLKGLIGYKREGAQRTVRLLYFIRMENQETKP